MDAHGQKSRYEVYLDYFHTPRWFFDVRQEVFVANPDGFDFRIENNALIKKSDLSLSIIHRPGFMEQKNGKNCVNLIGLSPKMFEEVIFSLMKYL